MATILLALCGALPASIDWRDVVHGGGVQLSTDPSQYYNQPLGVQLNNGSWLIVLTNAGFTEGQANQRVVARLHPSPDLADPLYLPAVDIENEPWGPAAGWVVPLYVQSMHRVFVFYTFNGGNITHLPNSSESCRCQLVGGQWMRHSDDGGATWSPRLKLPIRVTSIDRGNPWHGETLQGWTVSKPLVLKSGEVLMPFTKIGAYVQGHDRQWVLRSDNIMTERDVSRIRWTTWPAGDGGLSQGCGALSGDIAEEGGLLELGEGKVLFIFRTENGNVNECVSLDAGESWVARPVRYTIGGELKSPRGPLTARRLADGSYALLFFNNGWKGYSPAENSTRNPYYLTLGQLCAGGNDILWAQPEVVLYGRGWLPGALAPAYNLAYPDLIEQEDGRIFVMTVYEGPPGSSCNRTDFLRLGGCGVSSQELHKDVISGLRWQLYSPTPSRGQLVKRSLLLELNGSAPSFDAPHWPDAGVSSGGITLEFWLIPRANTTCILKCGDTSMGLTVSPGEEHDGSVQLDLYSSLGHIRASSAPGVLVADNPVHLAVVLDGGPQMIYFVVNGRLSDGGRYRKFGYRFFRELGRLDSEGQRCALEASRARLYGSYLRVSELIYNFRATSVADG